MTSLRLALTLVAASTACTDFEELRAGVCGNAVVEAGEDCDTFAASGTSCRAAGGPGECRYACSAGEQGSPAVACPSGWSCGPDGLCRVPSGTFDVRPPFAGFVLGAADFDGDGRSDVITATGEQIVSTVRYFDAQGNVAASSSVSAFFPPGESSLRDLDGDGLDDVVAYLPGPAMGILRGRQDRSFVPTVQASFPVAGGDGARAAAADVVPWLVGDEPLVVQKNGSGQWVLSIETQDGSFPLLVLDGDPAAIAGEGLPAGDLDPTSACEEIVIGYDLGTQMVVHAVCDATGTLAAFLPPHTVQLAGGVGLRGEVFVADANSDGALDLIAAVTGAGGDGVHVAFGVVGQPGSFHSDPKEAAPPVPDDTTSALPFNVPIPAGPSAGVLAVGHLNDDPWIDFVTRYEVMFSRFDGGGEVYWDALAFATEIDSARVGDFNDNGLPDIVGGSTSRSTLTFMNGAGDEAFNVFELPTAAPTDHLAVGDFDGDLLLDVAFAELGTDGIDTLAVAFGRALAAPEAPLRIGKVGPVRRVVAGQNALAAIFGITGLPDKVFDLAVTSAVDGDDAGVVTLIGGSTTRQLQSPLPLVHREGEAIHPLYAAGASIGDVGGAEQKNDLAVVTTGPTGALVQLFVGTGAAKLAPAIELDLGADVDPFSCRASVGDLDGQAYAELVVAGNRYGETEFVGFVTIARLDSVGSAFEEPVMIQTPRPFAAFAPGGGVFSSPVHLADVDGDGSPDLVGVLGDFGVGAHGETGGARAAEETGLEIVVLWNEAGAFDPARIARVAVPPGDLGFLVAATPVQLDADVQLEIVLSLFEATYRLDVDPASRELSDPVAIPGVPGGLMPTRADLNGDGLDDLVIASVEESTVCIATTTH